ncbi:putative NADH-dependent butanol dehydrogenase 1 [Monoraphidium neglectum]|uniref:Putative NADH-dependent butanol dehydrogenase 1 n=1 Tax=Monoraphidium neglectum TaxID=145388 RepID=A0A0D2MW23_9CHLO|nr:putative NADH-dependent butanol dehydrogenase 1 [Monoraphidium neglectum]KIZ06745.1 putative NADH-dependent butanol dehydrogenase 1 [Monoraphidium neglectum]|eukprot:XP_013905764.1 putative NADH-dependent butanol dehydrogenase 1 [Monoraphidium neglectum]
MMLKNNATSASTAAAARGRSQLRCHAALAPFKGLAVQAAGGKFQPYEYEPKPLGPTEIEIKVTHNGLCHSDLHMRDDDWGITSFPLIAGKGAGPPRHEVVGEVAAKGDTVAGIEVGDRVGYGWLRDSCRKCRYCLRGEENLCLQQTPTIVGRSQQQCRTDVITGCSESLPAVAATPGLPLFVFAAGAFAYKIPDALGSAEAAPMLCAGITVYAPLRKHTRRPGMSVAVLGVGGLGHLAVQFAAAMGADVTALVRDDDEAGEALALGAREAATSARAFEEKKGSYDVVLNCASARLDFAKVLGLLCPDGVLIQVGIPGGGAEITLPLQDVVFSQKSLAGSIEMLEFAVAKGVKPMIETYKLSQINEAAARVASGRARYRVVMETDEI